MTLIAIAEAHLLASLDEDAESRGTATFFLTAGSEDVARMYARRGFERVGTSCIAKTTAFGCTFDGDVEVAE